MWLYLVVIWDFRLNPNFKCIFNVYQLIERRILYIIPQKYLSTVKRTRRSPNNVKDHAVYRDWFYYILLYIRNKQINMNSSTHAAIKLQEYFSLNMITFSWQRTPLTYKALFYRMTTKVEAVFYWKGCLPVARIFYTKHCIFVDNCFYYRGDEGKLS